MEPPALKTTAAIRGTTPQCEAAARGMRREMTPAEHALWQALRNRRLDGLKFRRQHPLGPFVLDFCCPALRLVIELDGGVHDESEQARYDDRRTEHLNAYGYRVLRFRNEEVLGDLPRVLAQIRKAAGTPSPPAPLPTTGRGE